MQEQDKIQPAPAYCPCSSQRIWVLLVMCFLLGSSSAFSQAPPGPSSPLYGARPEHGNPATGLPTALQEVRIEQKLDQQLPLDLVFRDESGQEVKLGQYFGKKPVVLALVYYDCPMLCTQVLNGMVTSFRVLPFQIGNEFDVVTVSFDPRETSALAANKKKVYVDYLPEKMRAGREERLAFSDRRSGKHRQSLQRQSGFIIAMTKRRNSLLTRSAIMLTTPQGKLSRYFYGIDYAPRDLRLGLDRIVCKQDRIAGGPTAALLLPLRSVNR